MERGGVRWGGAGAVVISSNLVIIKMISWRSDEGTAAAVAGSLKPDHYFPKEILVKGK